MDSFASLTRLYETLWMEARVAKVQICRDGACSFATTPHLLIDVVDVLLHRDNATAISYAWGEFDRQKRTVGHTVQPAKLVQLELGTEWIISDVVDRLAELSEAKPIWMDQLCTPQQEDKILKTLADIPPIFHTLDVVILFPGSLCGCGPKLVEKLSRTSSDSWRWKELEQDEQCLIRPQNQCLSSWASSWSRQMWTHQEFMHSQRIRCVWTSKTENPCVSLHDSDINVENLPPFQRKIFETLIENGQELDDALHGLQFYSGATENTLYEDFFNYVRTVQIFAPGEMYEQFLRFLLGEQLSNPNSGVVKLNTTFDFLMWLSAGAGMKRGSHRTHRKATRPQDYIVSVWTSCPNYIVPKGYRFMSVAELMQDALSQLQYNHGFALAVTAPRGLLGAELSGSAFWDTLEYLSEIDISCDVDLYRVLDFECIASKVLPELKTVPMIFHDTAQPSLSASAMSYKMLVKQLHEAFAQQKKPSGHLSNSAVTRIVIKSLHRIMSYCDEPRVQAVGYGIQDFVQEWFTKPINRQNWRRSRILGPYRLRIDPVRHYIQFLCDHHKTKAFDEAYSQELDSLVDSNKPGKAHNVVYNVVADALELDLEHCEKKNVQLIFSSIDNDERRPPRVGFCRGDVDIEDLASGKRKTVTVSIGGSKNFPSNLLYEAVHIDSESEKLGRPAYQVFAVWVPTGSIVNDEYGASAKWDGDLPEGMFGVLL